MAKEERVPWVNLPGLNFLLSPNGFGVAVFRVSSHPARREMWGGELETQDNISRNFLCLGVLSPPAVPAVFWGGVKRSFPCTAATIYVSQGTEKVLTFRAHSVDCYLLLNVTYTQVIKTVCVCSRRYKAPVVKWMILKYCSTVTQVTLKMTISVNRIFLFLSVD